MQQRELMELDLDKVRAIRVLGRGAMGTLLVVLGPQVVRPEGVREGLRGCGGEEARRGPARAVGGVGAVAAVAPVPAEAGGGAGGDPGAAGVGPALLPRGDLNALRHSLSDRVFSPSAIRFYLAELVSALAHLHSLGIVYRDLKPENILLGADGHVNLTDFDLSRHLHRSPKTPAPAPSSSPLPAPPRSSHRRNLTRILFASADPHGAALKKARSARVSPVSRRRTSFETEGEGAAETERSHSFVGTEEYVSPEVVRGEGHEFAVDWWALGILTYEMAFGRTPFRGRNRKETFRNVLTRHPEFPGKQRSDLTDLIARLLAKDPARRLGFRSGADDLKAHPFFRGVRWDLLTAVARPPYLPPLDDLDRHLLSPADGFDVRDYFKRLRHAPPPPPSDTPLDSSASSSLTDF
ncbi:Serine/threonine-protein kinase UCNL [Ananas comosus]|uniref:non-specific serine/threonine protein kinase n=1 Tax=Ananas comosus TaxID=4615 RepID=A0A199VD19_ANACO|nr:Serine/threonine-protein kinase UCNL [Ananas comosus]